MTIREKFKYLMKNKDIHVSRLNYSKLIGSLPENGFIKERAIYHAPYLSSSHNIRIDNGNKDALIVHKNLRRSESINLKEQL